MIDTFQSLVDWFGDNPIVSSEQIEITKTENGFTSQRISTGTTGYQIIELPTQNITVEPKTVYTVHAEPLFAWSVLFIGLFVGVCIVRKILGVFG